MTKRIVSMILCVILLLGCVILPQKVSAATMNSHAGAVTTSGGNLNVRNSASASSTVLASLKKGSYITLISKTGEWWKVEYAKGKYGYCHAAYITPIEGKPAAVSAAVSLNIRSGPGTNHNIIGSLSSGEVVIELASANGWSRILYRGTKTGYVSSRYLKGAGTVSYPAVSLSVPSFKQTDSRWANVTVGSSGNTMAKIGCATTAIAMMESYRNGKIIYPDAMAQKLRYTSSGSVYWPGDYTAVTSSTGYLSKIYNLLKAGKPVLFGAKNAVGGQHWVVITGYIGGSNLTASDFTIHDPGSNSRVNLQQFLDVYSYFYKFFYY